MITTKGKTLDAVLIEIAEALIKQGKRCTDRSGACMYHDGEGNSCAIGMLIPDNKATRDADGGVNSILRGLDRCDLGENVQFLIDNEEVLSPIQDFHDYSRTEDRLECLDNELQVSDKVKEAFRPLLGIL